MTRIALTWAALGFAVALLLAAALPAAFGDRSFVMRSGSMSPAIATGDVAVIAPISPLDAHAGDVVSFMDPDGSGRLISHRARSIQRVGDRVDFTTQGDANTAQEHWSVPVDGSVGRVVYRLPKLGYAIIWIEAPVGRVGLLIVPSVLLGLSLLRRIWRRDEPEGVPG
jgi:signal peptidase I